MQMLYELMCHAHSLGLGNKLKAMLAPSEKPTPRPKYRHAKKRKVHNKTAKISRRRNRHGS